MEDLKCSECRKCNRKGKPSVTKHSQYCDQVRGLRIRKPGPSLLQRIKAASWFKGFMRSSGKSRKQKEEEMEDEKIWK